MASPKSGLQWWDREFDEQGNPIRADVRQAAHEIWHFLCARVRMTLGDVAEAPELLEIAVAYISRHLNRAAAPESLVEAKRLLGLRFSQLLHKRASRLGRLECVGTAAELDNYGSATDREWVSRVNRWLDFEKMLPLLGGRNYTMFTMRRLGHDWDEVGEKLGIATDTARATFWHAIHKARQMLDANGITKNRRYE